MAVCGLLARGVSGLQLLNDLRDNNPALTTNGAALAGLGGLELTWAVRLRRYRRELGGG
ncbi:hypothetical protein MAHJHV63_50080 [Mycobacterium avium subsp. hominissuis]